MDTQGQLDIFKIFLYDFVTLLAMVWPGLLETFCNAYSS